MYNILISKLNNLSDDRVYEFLRYLISDEDLDLPDDIIYGLKGMIKAKSIKSIFASNGDVSCSIMIQITVNDYSNLSFILTDLDVVTRSLDSALNTINSIDEANVVIQKINNLYKSLMEYSSSIANNPEDYYRLTRLMEKYNLPMMNR